MAFSLHANGAWGVLNQAPSPAVSGTTFHVNPTDGANLPSVIAGQEYECYIYDPLYPSRGETVLITTHTVGSDTDFIMTRNNDGRGAKTILIGWHIAAGITKKALTDIESLLTSTAATVTSLGASVTALNSGAVLLAGRAGGQTVIGGTLTTQALNLVSNASHDGKINLGNAASMGYFDEASNVFRLTSTDPSYLTTDPDFTSQANRHVLIETTWSNVATSAKNGNGLAVLAFVDRQTARVNPVSSAQAGRFSMSVAEETTEASGFLSYIDFQQSTPYGNAFYGISRGNSKRAGKTITFTGSGGVLTVNWGTTHNLLPGTGIVFSSAGTLPTATGGTFNISSVSSANPAVITTSAPHGLTTNDVVTIAGSSVSAVNGSWFVTVTGASTFTIPVSGSPGSGAAGTSRNLNWGVDTGAWGSYVNGAGGSATSGTIYYVSANGLAGTTFQITRSPLDPFATSISGSSNGSGTITAIAQQDDPIGGGSNLLRLNNEAQFRPGAYFDFGAAGHYTNGAIVGGRISHYTYGGFMALSTPLYKSDGAIPFVSGHVESLHALGATTQIHSLHARQFTDVGDTLEELIGGANCVGAQTIAFTSSNIAGSLKWKATGGGLMSLIIGLQGNTGALNGRDNEVLSLTGDGLMKLTGTTPATGTSFWVNAGTASQSATLVLAQSGTAKWSIGKQTDQSFYIFQVNDSRFVFTAAADALTGTILPNGTLTVGGGTENVNRLAVVEASASLDGAVTTMFGSAVAATKHVQLYIGKAGGPNNCGAISYVPDNASPGTGSYMALGLYGVYTVKIDGAGYVYLNLPTASGSVPSGALWANAGIVTVKP